MFTITELSWKSSPAMSFEYPLVAKSLIALVAFATASLVPDTVTVAGTVLSRSPLGVEIEAPVVSWMALRFTPLAPITAPSFLPKINEKLGFL